jgi:hypothetical protein
VGEKILKWFSDSLCSCNSFWTHAWWILTAVALVLATRPGLLKYVAVRLLFLGVLTGAASTVFFELYSNPGSKMALDQLIAALIAYGAALYTGLCQLLQSAYGKRLTVWRGDKWAKELDYPYLFIGGLGLVVSMNRLDTVSNHLVGVEIIGPLIVTTAIAIRLVKTRVEIAGWNRKEFYDSPTIPPS